MKLENEFTVNVPVEDAWNVLLDLERVTPCLPGAALTEQSDDDEYKGEMKVRLGPVTQEYNGTVRIEEADESEHRAVLKADGKDARGQGAATATITSTLHDEGDGSTKVRVETDMQITGRAAQFGRGVQQDVAERLLSRFAECLENEIVGGGAKEEAEAAATSEAGPLENGAAAEGASEEEEQPRRRIIQQDREVEPLDLGEASRDAVLKRVKQAAPVAAGVVALVVVIWLVRRR
ncbi:MAG: SRPBCC family protein [Actinomycetota bacterium]|nr:SRPBCC family protein [Actinomycetota bacterium]